MTFALPVTRKIESQHGKTPDGCIPGNLTQNSGVARTRKTMTQHKADITGFIGPMECAGQFFALKIMEVNLLLHGNFPVQVVPGCVGTTL